HVHHFKRFMQSSTPSQRQEFVDDSRFHELLDEYTYKPSLHNSHLDWLLLDLFVAIQCISLIESYMKLKHGMSYDLFQGVGWKIFLWKLVMWPIGFFLGWVLPGVGFYHLAQWSAWAGIGLAIVYYGFSIWATLYWLWSKIADALGVS